MISRFENFLNVFTEQDWNELIAELLPTMHEVDRIPVQIWFRFHPLSLFQYLEAAEDKADAIHGFAIKGKHRLEDDIDGSHTFLYGHRYWGDAKSAIASRIDSFDIESSDITAINLADEIKQIAKSVAVSAKVEESLTLAIVAVGIATLAQVGSDAFKASPGVVSIQRPMLGKSAKQLLEQRAKDDSQGLFGFLKTVNKQYTVTFDENADRKFTAVLDQEIATAAAKVDFLTDDRCSEGPIPVECRSAACGTCWIGVLSGKERLGEVEELERKALKTFGYNPNDNDSKPFIRLGCRAKVHGAVSITIPSWNGVFGKKIYGNIERAVLEPVTTTAKRLRDTIEGAMK
jgi:ferredoxin